MGVGKVVCCIRMLVFFLSITLAVCETVAADTGSSMSARYVQPRGDHIKWKILIPSPPPAAVYLARRFPATDTTAWP